jgi:signal transduction histidine kinase
VTDALVAEIDHAAEDSRVRRWVAGAWHRLRPHRLGLRTRVLMTFVLGSLALSVFLAAVTYSFTKSTLLRQRDRTGIEAAYKNASRVRDELAANPGGINDLVNRLLQLGGGRPVVYARGEFSDAPSVLPEALRTRVLVDQTPTRMITRVRGEPTLVVGIPLPDVNGAYFELFSLAETANTLRNVRVSLITAGAITTILGWGLGIFAARRAVRPLADAALAAKAFASGRLDTRLESTDDPDLETLSNAFNEMARSLQQRVERDARFASDVSHELRSPLMTLSASVEVLQSRRDEMPERAQTALDLLASDVARFQGLVEDLLEISRFDAGAVRLNLDDLPLAEFVRQAVAVSSVPTTPVRVVDRGERLLISGDKRRLARVIANLIDNARLHGGGEFEITVSAAAGEPDPASHAWIAVEDHGSGVPEEERELVFERFARGMVAGRRSSSEGAGLGLALVDEHVRLHGGRVWVEDRLDGEPGARFVIELPAEEVGG